MFEENQMNKVWEAVGSCGYCIWPGKPQVSYAEGIGLIGELADTAKRISAALGPSMKIATEIISEMLTSFIKSFVVWCREVAVIFLEYVVESFRLGYDEPLRLLLTS